MTRGDLVLGCDFGTSSVKAGLFSADGALLASASAAYPLHTPRPGHVEQDPHDWWRAMARAAREALAQVDGGAGRVRAIGIAAQLCGCVPVDAQGEPLHRCLTSLDTRSAPIARAITAGGPRIGGYGVLRLAGWLRLANGAPNLSGKDPLSKILWFRAHQPDVWRRCARFLDVKDWLLARCTGEFATTPDAAQLTWLMDNRSCEWSPAWLERLGIAAERLPRIVRADATAGALTSAAAADLGLPAGLPVSGGVGDVNGAALGAGNAADGAYHLCIGTSLWLGAHSPRRRVDVFTGIATLCAAQAGRYLLVAAQENGGAAASWAASTFGFDSVQALDEAARRTVPGADTPLFAPWVFGERVPLQDAGLRPALSGASARTSHGDVAYAVLAGVALNARWALAEAERCQPSSIAEIRVLGGAASDAWTRVLADMLQRPLSVLSEPAFGAARGAAMTAAVAAGWFHDLGAAAAMTRAGREVAPDAARRGWADERYGELRELGKQRKRSRHA
jgi:xylulokinase